MTAEPAAPEPVADPYGQAGLALSDEASRLYVSPEAVQELGALSPTAQQVDSLRAQLAATSADVFVALLPAAASAVEGAPPQLLYEATGRPGTYLVVVADGQFDAGSTDLPGSTVDGLAGEAYAASGGDLGAFMSGFVTRVEGLAGGGTVAVDEGWPVDARTVGIGAGGLALLLGGSVLVWRRNRRRAERAEVATVRPVVEADVAAYQQELRRLRHEVEVRRHQAAGASLARAERDLERAAHALNRVEHADEIQEVTAALAQGGWHLAVTRERLGGGDEPGERRPPCFFDPGHGPALTEVPWAPAGGARRRVPACAGDAALARQGLDPAVREVPVGKGVALPYVDAGHAYGGWAAGYHGAALPALLADTPLGAAVGGQHLLAEGGFDAGGGWAGGRGIEEEPG